MIFRYLFIISILLSSCKKKEATSVIIIGHAGMGLDFPGSVYHNNSKEAFQLALDMSGSDGVEMDIRLSKDGDLWAFHDEMLDESTDGSGCVEEKCFKIWMELIITALAKEKLMR